MGKKSNHLPEQSETIKEPKPDWLQGNFRDITVWAIEEVSEALEKASVNTKEKVIVWPDGQRLSVHETATRIKKESEYIHALEPLMRHVMIWLEMECVPEDIKDEKMDEFEHQIDEWLEEYAEWINKYNESIVIE